MHTDDTDTTLVGTAVGNYQVIGRLGEGAMGEVYLGEHPAIGRRVAIKVVMASLSANPEVTERFLSEARAVSKVNHPNIIQIFDFGTLPDGRLYYVMEYLDGQDLSELLEKRAPLPPREAIELLKQITGAMETAHAAGIVHRDLKPDNIFVAATDGGPLVKILDFGIAKLLEPAFGSQSRTATGMIMGTPLYMSPEQAAGRVSEISQRTDIYALGIISYEMLAGRCPFQDKTTALVLTMHITKPPPPLETFVHGLPPSLETFVQRALAKDPDDRQQTMNEFFLEFQKASTGGLDAHQETIAYSAGVVRHPGTESGIGDAPTMAGDASVPPDASALRVTGTEETVADTGSGVNADTTLGRSATESVPNGALVASQSRGGGRAWLIVLMVLLTLGVAGGTWYALRSGQPDPKTNQAPAAPVAQAPDAAVPAPIMRPTEAARPMPPARPVIRRIRVASRKGRLKVRVTVPGAPSYSRKTPFTVDARQGEQVVLVASRFGYQPQTRTLTVAGDSEVVFQLTRLGRTRTQPTPRQPPVMRTMDVGESTLSPFKKK